MGKSSRKQENLANYSTIIGDCPGYFFCLVCKIIEKFIFSKTPSNGK